MMGDAKNGEEVNHKETQKKGSPQRKQKSKKETPYGTLFFCLLCLLHGKIE
jgi:hypothetical protein